MAAEGGDKLQLPLVWAPGSDVDAIVAKGADMLSLPLAWVSTAAVIAIVGEGQLEQLLPGQVRLRRMELQRLDSAAAPTWGQGVSIPLNRHVQNTDWPCPRWRRSRGNQWRLQ